MKDSRIMDFIRERIRESTIDLRSSCASVAETDIFQDMDEDTLFDLINDVDRLKQYAIDLIAAKRVICTVECLSYLKNDAKILSKALSDANERSIYVNNDYNKHCALLNEIVLIDMVMHEVIAKNEELMK